MTTTALDVLFGEGDDAVAELEKALRAVGAPAARLLGVNATRIAEVIVGWLDQPLAEGLKSAWHQVEPVIDALHESVAGEGSSLSVTMFEHAREIDHRGHLTASRSGGKLPLLDLIMNTVLKLDTVSVDIDHGRIVRLGLGPATASIKLNFSWPDDEDLHLLREVVNHRITLPGFLSSASSSEHAESPSTHERIAKEPELSSVGPADGLTTN